MNRVVYTNNLCVERRKYYRTKEATFKPVGLWYSINGEWEQWVLENMDSWKRKYTHIIDVDTSKLLIISTLEALDTFIDKYKSNREYRTLQWGKLIDEGYYGIEFLNYWDIKNQAMNKFDFNYAFYWGLDCSSGCIWNMDAIKLY